MPGAELARQRAAYWAGVFRAALLGGAIALVMAGLALSSVLNKHRADINAVEARVAALNAQTNAKKALESEKKEKQSEQRARKSALIAQAEQQKAEEFSAELFQTFKGLTAERSVARANYDKAREAAARASNAESAQKQETRRLHRVLYDATMNLVQRQVRGARIRAMQELLNQTRNQENRGFEWRFWQGLCPLQHTLSTHTGEVLCAASAPDGKRFVTGGADKSVVVSDTASGKTLCSWKEDGEVRAAAFFPDGSRIAVGLSGNDRPGRAVIRAANSGRAIVTLPLSKAAWDVTFSHDGKRLATNGERVQNMEQRHRRGRGGLRPRRPDGRVRAGRHGIPCPWAKRASPPSSKCSTCPRTRSPFR